jgi:hypothetical protein
VSNSHPLAGLWQPSYLHELDKFAQAAADTALAALDLQVDADVRGIRFVHAYKRLHKQLTPFRQHDPDRPETWPREADPGLLFALLRLLDVLTRLEPPAEIAAWGRGRKKQSWFDGGEAAANLKELRPTVERLHKTAEQVHQLVRNLLECIGERLTRSVEAKTSGVATMPEKQQVGQRLTINLESNAVTLDGKHYASLDPGAVRILQAIHGAGSTITSIELQAVRGCKGKRIDRYLRKLPAPLRQIVRSATGKGYWIELPPQPSA